MSHGHKWRDVHAGVDFFGSPFSYRYLEPKDCCLYHIEWTNSPYASLQESEALLEALMVASSHSLPHTPCHPSGFCLEHLAWDMVHKPCPVIPAPSTALQHRHHASTSELTAFRCTSNIIQHHAAASFVHYAEDARQPVPQPYFDPPLPSGPSPTITPEEAASVSFSSRNDLLRFLLLLGAFGAMVVLGRQPFWVWKSFPDS